MITLFIKEQNAPPPVEIGHQYKYGDVIEFKDNFYGNCKGNVYAVSDKYLCTVYSLKANCDSGIKDMKFKYYTHRYTDLNCSINGLVDN